MDESRLKEGTAIRRIREEQLALLQGPRMQVTFLYGVFGGQNGIQDPEALDQLKKSQMGRIRLVITETGGRFEELGQGRFCATLGTDEPTEEDPLMAVTIGLKLLRLAKLSKKAPELRLTAVTGRVPEESIQGPLLPDPKKPSSMRGHELLTLSQKLVRVCPAGALYVEGLTARMVRDTHRIQRITDLKGALANIPVYAVSSGVGSTSAAFEPLLCGRDKELRHMMKLFERLERGEGPTFFTVTGDLGIGKTRMMRAFAHEIELRATIFLNPRERRRIDRWRRTPYSYFGEILRFFFDITENEAPAISRNKLVKGLHATLSGSKKRELPLEMAHYLGLLCQIDFPESPFLRDQSPAQLEQSSFMAFCHYLEQASQHKPIVLLLDDLYSADDSSLRLLKHLTQHLEPSRVLFLCASRQELLGELERGGQLDLSGEKMILKPLNRESSRRLILELLQDQASLPDLLTQRILDIAEGNPFFLREIMRDLSEQGAIEALSQSQEEGFEIPENIEGILLSRLSRLSHAEREVLQKAAVFGKTFWRGGVEMLFRQEADIDSGWRLDDGDVINREDDLEQLLENLTEHGVIQYHSDSDFEGDTQFTFTPSWLQELVYKEVPKELLGPYHRLVGMWLELQAQRHQSTPLHGEIAHHFDLGHEPTRAAPYHIEVGIRARKVYATSRAIHHLERGIQHLEESHVPKQMQALREIAEAYILDGEYAKALERFETLLHLSWQMGHRVLAGEIYIRMGRVHYLMRDFQNALKMMKNGHTLHQEGGHLRGIAAALSNMGEVYLLIGDFQKARLYLQEALELRRELEHGGDLAYALSNMGNLLIEQGELQAAKKYHEEALELRKSLGNPHMIIRSMNNLSMIHMIQGDYDAALAELIVSSNIAQKIGEKLMMAVVTSNIGELYLLRGELPMAEKYLNRALELAQRIGDKLIEAECHRLQGELLLEQGDMEKALEFCSKAYALITERGILSAQTPIYRLLGEIYSAQDDEALAANPHGLPEHLLGDPLKCYEESLALARRLGNLREEARTRMLLGIFEVNRSHIGKGSEELHKAKEIFTRLGMESERSEVEEMLVEVAEYQTQQEASTGPAPEPPPPPTSLRPPRSGLANVEKTMSFRVTFDDNEIGPPPTPAELSEVSESSEVPLAQRPTEPPASRPASRPSSKTDEELPKIRPTIKNDHTLSIKTPVIAVASESPGRTKTKAHTLTTHVAVSAHEEPSAKPEQAGKKPPPPPSQKPTEPVAAKPLPKPVQLPSTPPTVDATVKHAPPLATLLEQGVLKHARATPSSEELPALVPEAQPPLRSESLKQPTDTRELRAPSNGGQDPISEQTSARIPAQNQPEKPDDGELLSEEMEGEAMIETMSVVDTHLYKERGEEIVNRGTLPPIDAKNAGPAKSPASPPKTDPASAGPAQKPDLTRAPAEAEDTEQPNSKKTQKLKPPTAKEALQGIGKRKQSKTPPPPPVTRSKRTPTSTEGSDDDAPVLNIPSRLTPLTDTDAMPFLFPNQPVKEPSVYDSQVIIAQVSEGDDISRSWFEEGRSDRTDKFWEERKDDLQAVKEELMHEQVIQEIDKLQDDEDPKKP